MTMSHGEMVQMQAAGENRCVCCGEIIPEGRQVCPNCEAKASLNDEFGFKQYGIHHAYPTNIIRDYIDTDIISGGKTMTKQQDTAFELMKCINAIDTTDPFELNSIEIKHEQIVVRAVNESSLEDVYFVTSVALNKEEDTTLRRFYVVYKDGIIGSRFWNGVGTTEKRTTQIREAISNGFGVL